MCGDGGEVLCAISIVDFRNIGEVVAGNTGGKSLINLNISVKSTVISGGFMWLNISAL